MLEKAPKQMIQELYQAVIGIPGNPDDNGLIGDVKEIKRDIKNQNNRVNKLENKQKFLYGLIAGSGILGGGIGAVIAKLFGG